MENQNIQKAGDNAKQIGQIGQAETINIESPSITIEKDAIASAIISGNGNRVVIYQYQIQHQVTEDPSARVGEIGLNPYKGLLAFQETDGDRFFGREKQIEQLWNKFRSLDEDDSAIRLLPIYGPSGSGKSSLARAGLIPELARRPLPGYAAARVAVLVPGTHPLEALASVLARVATNDSTPVAKTREFAGELKQANEGGEYDGLRRIADVLPDIAFSPLVVLVDQFEEVYSLCEKQEERDAFIGNLLSGASTRSRHVWVVITLRSDFLGETQKHPVLNRLFARQGFLVPSMDEEELRQAIRKPAEIAGHPLDEATIELLIKDTQGREGALPLLQFALTRIWEGLADGKEPTETLKAIGGVGGALAGEAQRIYESLKPEERDIARRVFLGLVQLGEGTQDTRRRTEIKKVVSHRDSLEQVKQVIARFAAPGVRLITLAANANADTAEVTHEALFDHWQQLQKWLDGSRSDIRFGRRLDEAAVYWDENGRPEGNLWRPPDLDLLRRYRQRAGDDMTPLQEEFFQASERYENNRQRRRQMSISGLVAGLVLTTGSAAFTIYQLQRMQRQRVEQLALTAETLISQEPVNAVVNAIAAIGLNQSAFVKFPNYPLSVSAYSSLLSTVQANREQNQLRHEDWVTSVAFSPDGKKIVSGSTDNTLRLWDASTGQPIGQPWRGHEDEISGISSVAFSPDSKYIVSGCANDETLRLWDASTGQPIGQPLRGHEYGISSVVFSPDGKHIVSGGRMDETLRLWNASTGQPIGQPWRGHEDEISSVAFSPDGKYIVSGGKNFKTLRLWNVSTGQPIGQPLRGHQDGVNSVAFSPDGKHIVSGSDDKTLRLWNASTGQPIGQPLRGHEDLVNSVAFSPDGKRIVSGSRDKTLHLWDASTGQPIGQPLRGHEDLVNSVAFSPDGKRIVSGSADKTLRLWNASTGQRQPLRGHQDAVFSVAFSPDGKKILSSSRDNTLRLWDASTGQPIRQPFRGHQGVVSSVAFSPDGKKIVSGSGDKTLRLWDAFTGQPIGQPLRGHQHMVLSVAFSPNGKHLVSGSADKTLRLWNASTGQLIGQPLRGHEYGISSVAFSPNGKHIVSGSGDKTLRLWNASTGQPIGQPFRGHQGVVSSVAFSPDGKHIVSGSGDGDKTLRLWDASTGQAFRQPFRGHQGGVSSVAFSPDGKHIVSGSGDKTLRLWDVVSWESLLETACEQLRHHPILVKPTTDVANSVAKEARDTCKSYVWH